MTCLIFPSLTPSVHGAAAAALAVPWCDAEPASAATAHAAARTARIAIREALFIVSPSSSDVTRRSYAASFDIGEATEGRSGYGVEWSSPQSARRPSVAPRSRTDCGATLRPDEPHARVHVLEGGRRRLARLLRTDVEQPAQLSLVGAKLRVLLLHRPEELDNRVTDVTFQVAIATAVVRRLDLGDRRSRRHRQDLDEVRHARLLVRCVTDLASRVGDRRFELLPDHLGRIEHEHGPLVGAARRRHLLRRLL